MLIVKKIIVYSKSGCPQCESAKSLLKARSLPYEEIKIDDEAERLEFYSQCGPSVRQMPQVFINDQRVGGLAGRATWPPWRTGAGFADVIRLGGVRLPSQPGHQLL